METKERHSLSELLREIREDDIDSVVLWLEDRAVFQKWMVQIVTATFVVIIFLAGDEKASVQGVTVVSFICMAFSIICNLICVWAIPSWKLLVRARVIRDARRLRFELAIMTWIGLTLFLAGLVLPFILASKSSLGI